MLFILYIHMIFLHFICKNDFNLKVVQETRGTRIRVVKYKYKFLLLILFPSLSLGISQLDSLLILGVTILDSINRN